MSETDSDDYYSDEDEINNNPNQNLIPNANENNKKVVEFIGTIGGKAGWIKCFYCDRYHPQSMHLVGVEYCGHCWAWLNSKQLDLEKGIYTGQNSITDIKKYLKDTFKLHNPNKCMIKDCIYNKIIKLSKEKKLHRDFCLELGFEVEPEEKLNKNNYDNKSKHTETKIKFRTNPKINYKLSHISI